MVVSFALILIAAASSRAMQLGEAWTQPTSEMLGDRNADLRARSSERYLVARGDFDGDGQPDRAAVMVRAGSGEAAVLLYLANRLASPLVLQTLGARNLAQIGIETVKAGIYQPSCARQGGADCDPSTRITLPHEGISLFTFEGPATYYWIDAQQVKSAVIAS